MGKVVVVADTVGPEPDSAVAAVAWAPRQVLLSEQAVVPAFGQLWVPDPPVCLEMSVIILSVDTEQGLQTYAHDSWIFRHCRRLRDDWYILLDFEIFDICSAEDDVAEETDINQGNLF